MVAIAVQDDNLVPPESGCPNCKQRDADSLEWIDDQHVRCTVCHTVYTPPGGTTHA